MQKSEWVYRELLYRRLEKGEYRFNQLQIARKLALSLSTVHAALAPLEAMGAITKTAMGFRLVDPKKLLFFWASKRNITKDLVYQTHVNASVSEMEKNMPSGIVYAAYSAYRFKFDDAPADYSEVYVYSDEETLKELKRRFPQMHGPSNLFALNADMLLKENAEKRVCSVAHIFVDIWNIRTWYAKEFLQALEKRIGEALA